MEKTGWIKEIIKEISEDWEAFSQKEKSAVAIEYKQGMDSTLEVLSKIRKEENVETILATEKAILRNTLKFYANSQEMKSSLKAGLEDLKVAQKSLEIVQNSSAYQAVKDAMSRKDIVQGLPQDGFRKFEKSHQTRLSNLLKTSLSTKEKALIRQRKSNLKVAKEKYMELQRKVLGIKQEKGLER